MNTKSNNFNRSAVALVLVLGFLVIISALAVAFFSSVTTELRASRNFQGNVNTRQLQDSVVNLVEGQIRQATVVDPHDVKTQNRAWASQPGMIQTFGDGGGQASAAPLVSYKLYSSNVMSLPGQPSGPDYINGWDTAPAIWTDLNAPLMVPDPSNSAATVPRFPIIDPRSNNTGDPNTNIVEGFNFNTGVVSETVAGGGNNARLPMPVRWIYVLKDGSLTVPGNGSGTTALFAGMTNAPTMANPIIGRVAFWTDDDTSKLNVNTAGGSSWISAATANGYTANQYAGSFWDTPRMNSVFDQGQVYGPNVGGYVPGASGNGGQPLPNLGGLAAVQMLQNEFQRYPGHPATTSMANVFKGILTSEQMYKITPRIAYNTYQGIQNSAGGTNRLHIEAGSVPGANTSGQVANAPVPIRYDRLYDSVDEMVFCYQRNGGPSGPRRTNIDLIGLPPLAYTNSNVSDTTTFTPGLLDRMRFFLTAFNRAPDLNLYGHPRVCVWPVRSQNWADDIDPTKSGINAYDSLSLFCSTVGPAVFNYTGFNSDGATTSHGPFHYSFFRHEPAGTANPPNGMSLVSQTQDIDLPRNQQLLTYLQQQTSQKIPGFGSSFGSKYNNLDVNETLVEIFDYIRAANLNDSTITNTGGHPMNPHPFSPTGIVMPSATISGPFAGTLGMGRFPTICEATILFYYCGSDTSTGNAANSIYPVKPNATGTPTAQFQETSKVLVITPPDTPLPTGAAVKPVSQVPQKRFMRAAFLLSTFNPMQGYGPVNTPASTGGVITDPLVTFEVSGLDSFTVSPGTVSGTGPAFGSVTGGIVTVTKGPGDLWGGRNFGGFEGFAHTLYTPGNNYPLLTPLSAKIGLSVNPTNNHVIVAPPPPTVAASSNADYQETIVPTFKLSAGSVSVKVKFGGVLLQTIAMNFPTATLPAPRGDDIIDAEPFAITAATAATTGVPTLNLGKPILANTLKPTDNNPASASNGQTNYNAGNVQAYGQLRRWYWQSDLSSFDPNAARTVPARPTTSSTPQGFSLTTPDGTGSPAGNLTRGIDMARDFQLRINYALSNNANSNNPATTSATGTVVAWRGAKWRQLVQPGDTVRSVIFCDPPTATGTTTSGDMRLAAVTSNLTAPSVGTGKPGFYPHPDYTTTTMQQASLLRMADGELYFNYAGEGGPNGGGFFPTAASATTGLGPSGYTPALSYYSTFNPFGNHVALGGLNGLTNKQFPQGFAVANLPRKLSAGSTGVWVNGVVRNDTKAGDFDTGVGAYCDGSFFNKQDEGNAIFASINFYTGVISYPIPYFGNGDYTPPSSAFNSPNRQMPSPAMIGSLLSRAASGFGWETLCLCPFPAGINHHGNDTTGGAIKDHLLMDLFQMPIVQPYPISEPFSTAGRVNMNYVIQPFDYIERSTALRAVLASERVTIMGCATNTTPQSLPMYQVYKGGTQMTSQFRFPMDRKQTMAFISTALTTNGLFRSPSQICEIPLIPTSWNASTMAMAQSLWSVQGDLTGDNVREKPYADLYPRLTTKSNTYTVHMRVQSLRQLVHTSDSGYQTWDESKDYVLGEYRGSSSIERYIDPSDRRFNPLDPLTISNNDLVFPDLTTPNNSLELLYRFRTVNTKAFAPY